jgi:hypothetical protein
MTQINQPQARAILRETEPPPLLPFDADAIAESMNTIVYNVASQCRTYEPNNTTTGPSSNYRWKQLLEDDDTRALWKAIQWNGTIASNDPTNTPSDETFKAHFERLLNPPQSTQPNDEHPDTPPVYLPVTDDPIQPEEVLRATQRVKANKSGGPSGVPPGLLRIMPTRWLAYLAMLFSLILSNSTYPRLWSISKLVVLFKKGAKGICDNYRGISLMDTFAKLFDSILNKRLEQWFQPDREQAGSQRGRGCVEHLLTLRLLIDFAIHKKKKMFVVFVDFSKAYDRVPRHLLLRRLQSLGCGAAMIKIISAMYSHTSMMLRSATITTSIGVRQGSPTSCFLFTLLVNDLIRRMKNACPPDSFLGWLHTLMLMDDTVILASTRDRAIEKLQVLEDFCASSGMIINGSKTKFMVVNGEEEDKVTLKTESLNIKNCNSYTYLGCIYTQDGKMASAVKAQLQSKWSHVAKFEAFVKKNNDAPYMVKEKVFTAALASAILYGMETWLSPAAIETARPTYMQCIRLLLGVRKTTAGDLCLVEAGQPSLLQKVKTAQRSTIYKLIVEREGMQDDPFAHAWSLARNSRTPCARYITSLETFRPEVEERRLREKIQTSERTKFVTYRDLMNPGLEVHPMYRSTDSRERERLTLTKFRLSSHNLAIERGRWTRKPREERLCPTCNVVQDEHHAVTECRINADARRNIEATHLQLPQLFDLDQAQCHELLKFFV